MKRTLLPVCLVASLVAAFSATPARAEVHVDFLFGGGGYYHHHHHHHPHYRYWADYYWYAPPPAVRYVPIAPAPVVYVPTASAQVVAAPVAAAPAALPTTSLQTATPTLAPSQAAATPNLRNNPVPSRTAAREASNEVRSTVSIANPAGSGGQVSFIIDGDRELTLAPGETKTLNDAENYVVEFDRGEAYGTTRIVLADGSYEFAVTASGWDLQRRSSVAMKPSVRRNTLPSVQR